MAKYLFGFNVVGLSPAHLKYLEELPACSQLIKNGKKAIMEPVFPCLTIPGQASLATGKYPHDHGMIANGLFYRDRFEVSFWDQYRALLQAEPFWESIKKKKPELKTAVLFWQSTLYGNADIIITPKPMHTDHRMIPWCYSKPVGLYENLVSKIEQFDLRHYWGPMASPMSSRWIMDAAISVLKEHRPNLMMTYLPILDYSCQRFGPEDPGVLNDLKIVDELIGNFLDALDSMGIKKNSAIALFSEYSMSRVTGAAFPNLLLREAGFLDVREIEGREYLDIEMSRAFAMVDHQIAHVFVQNKEDEKEVAELLQKTDGIQLVLNKDQQKKYMADHERSGELLAVADHDRWFAYYWWNDPEKAPDFAHTVDIHRKPGYDPLELFFAPDKKGISMDTSLIKGSHGAPAEGKDRKAVLMIGGDGLEDLALAQEIEMVEVASIFEKILL